MDLALEPGCSNPRAHPRWMQHRAHLRDAVVPRSRPQTPPANVTETYSNEHRWTYRNKAYLQQKNSPIPEDPQNFQENKASACINRRHMH